MKSKKSVSLKNVWIALCLMIVLVTGIATPAHAAKQQLATFGKTSPANGAINQPSFLILEWEAYPDATNYSYCVDTVNNDTCDTTWVDVGNAFSAAIRPAGGATHYWQVKANGPGETEMADGDVWWSFSTPAIAPSSFDLIAPAWNAVNQSVNVELSWSISQYAQYYDYCIDIDDNNDCDTAWHLAGQGAGTVSTTPDTLEFNTPYFWAIRAVNPIGITTTSWYKFTTEVDITDSVSPHVNSITHANVNPTSASSLDYAVNFSEPVTGVDVTDFLLVKVNGATSPNYGETITGVSGSGASYVVTVDAGSMQLGELRLDLFNNYSIKDRGGNSLALTDSFTGAVYLVDKIAPYVVNIRLADAIYGYPYQNPTDEEIVSFLVNFSEPVLGVDNNDFALTKTGSISGESILDVTGSSGTYVVRANTGSGNGELGLTVLDDDSIVDQALTPLFGVGAYNYTSTRYYVIEKNETPVIPPTTPPATQPVTQTATFLSQGSYDGWVREESEYSNKGYKVNSGGTVINVGDDAGNRQYRGVLSFDTSGIPDNAVITSVTLKVKEAGIKGKSPFKTHRELYIDLNSPYFGKALKLQPHDFQKKGSFNNAGTLPESSVSDWHTANLGSITFPYINKAGTTQFRLRFKKADNNDNGADYVKFYSGNAETANVPQLIVEFYVP